MKAVIQRLAGRSVRSRITLAFGVFVALAMATVTTAVGVRLHGAISDNLARELDARVRQDASLLLQRIDYLLESAQVLVRNPLVVNGLNDAQGRQTYLPELVKNFREGRDVHAVALVGYDGRSVYSSLESLPTYADSAELRSALATGLVSYLIDATRSEWVVFVPVTYYSTTQGALVVVFDLAAIARHVLPSDGVIRHSLRADTRVLFSTGGEAETDVVTVSHDLGKSGTGFLSSLPLRLEVSSPRQHHLEPARRAVRDVAVLGLLLTLLAIAIAYWMSYSISRPIVTLRQRVREADGSEGRRCAPLGTNDELEDLAENFDRRTQELRNIQLHLEDLVAQRTRELEVARDAAESASRFKSSFLANMSHEIRTPMNAIIGLTYLLRRALPDPRQVEQLDKITGAAQHLLGIINDILDFSKIEAGKLGIEAADVDLERLFRTLSDLLSSRAAEKSLEMITRIDPAIPAALIGDEMRIRQILLNFGSNAIKFTEQGHVIFKASAMAADGDLVRVRFEVTDTGIGLSEEQVGRLFQAFEQADTSTTRRFGGTGLGLAISRRLVELMGGEIGVVSAPGSGSTFWFELPLRRGRATTLARSLAALPSAPRVLLVDDVPEARAALNDMLTAYSAQVTEAGSGEEAVAAAQAAATAGTPYDLVLMDWAMPGMDGLEASRRIRTMANGTVPRIVMVTAFGADTEGPRLREAGILAQLTKPVTPSLLHDGLVGAFGGHALRQARSPATATVGDVAGRFAGCRVLLAEDNPVNREVALSLLEDTGLQVDVAADGVEAVALASVQPYDLILMDVQMPRMDGLEATRTLRRHPEWAERPILAMTANAFSEDRQACLEAGMDDHIAKPVDPVELFDALSRWLPVPSTGMTGVSSPAPPVPSAEASAEVSAETSADDRRAQGILEALGEVDLVQGLSVVKGRWPAYRRLLRLFADSNGEHPARIRAALASGDHPEAQRLAHSLKGGAANLGLPGVSARAATLESALKGGDATGAEAALEALDAQWPAVMTALREAAMDPPADTPAAGAEGGVALDELRRLLAEDNIEARAWHAAHRSVLEPLLGGQAAAIGAHIDRFEFDRARTLLPSAGP